MGRLDQRQHAIGPRVDGSVGVDAPQDRRPAEEIEEVPSRLPRGTRRDSRREVRQGLEVEPLQDPVAMRRVAKHREDRGVEALRLLRALVATRGVERRAERGDGVPGRARPGRVDLGEKAAVTIPRGAGRSLHRPDYPRLRPAPVTA